MRPGVCLTYDDASVLTWAKAMPLFKEFGAKATFCVTQIHMMGKRKIGKLRYMQDQGHEVAFHSRNHYNMLSFVASHGFEAWLNEEIDAGIADFVRRGFEAKSFSLPFYACSDEGIEALIKRFSVIRWQKAFSRLGSRQVDNRIIKPELSTGVVHSIGSIDFSHHMQGGMARFEYLLDRIVARKGIGVFNGHMIGSRPKPSAAEMRHGAHSYLEDKRTMFEAIRARDLEFYCLQDLARPIDIKTKQDAFAEL